MSDSVTFSWAFPALEIDHDKDGLENVVTLVHWRLKAKFLDFEAEAIGTIQMGEPGQPFTAFEDITHDMIQGWVESAMDAQAAQDETMGRTVAQLKEQLEQQIANKIAPKQSIVAPPWV